MDRDFDLYRLPVLVYLSSTFTGWPVCFLSTFYAAGLL
jgi:hypothetical protein